MGWHCFPISSQCENRTRGKNDQHKQKKIKTENSNYRTRKHLTKFTEETQKHEDKHSTVQSERQHNEVGTVGYEYE